MIDDAHLLDDGELEQLADRVADPASTVVVATEPLAHRPALRALATAIERENPVVSIGALSPPDVTRIATEILGAAPTPEFVARAHGVDGRAAVSAAAGDRRRSLTRRRSARDRDRAGGQLRADRAAAPVG